MPKGVPLVKRLSDLLLASLALILFSPVFLILSILVAIRNGFPILFRQKRPGLRGEIFTIYKFRTMKDAVDEAGEPLPDAQRLTRLGRFLRGASLDELPELINILKGDMSLVGPRPLLVQYLPLYSEQQARRHEVLPGLTGWAQVNGRNALTWQEKFALDVWYVDHWTFWLDVKIVARTIVKVLKREGISQPGQATAKPFSGNPPDTP
ncbi:MAG: sugar transferase [Chloroflexota bacterium]|nr:sugar transferase [Chloroflexota bacterium]